MNKVVELIRVSTEEQAAYDRNGIAGQRHVIAQILSRYDLLSIYQFEIVDVSGTQVWASPEFQRLLTVVKSPEITGVVVASFDRLIRPGKLEDMKVLDYLASSGTLVYTADGPIAPDSLTAAIRTLMAGEDRRQILSRMNSAKEAMRRAGKSAGGCTTIPFGTSYDRKRTEWSYTADAAKVKKAYKMLLRGETYAHMSDVAGIPRTSLPVILQNPIYIGFRLIKDKRDPTIDGYVPGKDGRQGYRKKIPRAAHEVINVRVIKKGLISEADFYSAQALIECRRTKRALTADQAAPHTTFKSHILCGDCGCPMYTGASQTWEYYYCKSHNTREKRKRAEQGLQPCSNKSSSRKVVESTLNELLSKKLKEPAFVMRVVNAVKLKLKTNTKGTELDGTKLQKQVQKLRSKRERVLQTFCSGYITKQQLDSSMKAIELELQRFEELGREAAETASMKRVVDSSVIQAAIMPLWDWECLSDAQKRKLLAAVDFTAVLLHDKITELRLQMLAPTGSADKDSRLKMGPFRSPERQCL